MSLICHLYVLKTSASLSLTLAFTFSLLEKTIKISSWNQYDWFNCKKKKSYFCTVSSLIICKYYLFLFPKQPFCEQLLQNVFIFSIFIHKNIDSYKIRYSVHMFKELSPLCEQNSDFILTVYWSWKWIIEYKLVCLSSHW